MGPRAVVFYGQRHLAPAARAISTSPPILATQRRTPPALAIRPKPVAAPARKRIERPPPSEPTVEVAPAPVERGAEEAGGSAAQPSPSGTLGLGNGGGGDPAALGAEPTSPRPASPADLASIGARVARELVYPALARRRRWRGRALVAFTLRADGSVGAIEIRESSGHPLLDDEAQRAIRRAAPFPAPGVELLVVVPVTFQLL